jgi:hypothetical protein
VVHLPGANRMSSEIYSLPEMEQVLNPILDCRKIRGAGAEGYWRACFTRFSLETHPQLGGDVAIDEEGTREKLRNLVDDMEPGLVLMGMSAKTLAPSVVDPTPHININIEAICIAKGCPIRIFKGAERGELASSQDDDNWNDRCRENNISYTNPIIVVGLIDRLISLGVLPEPKAKNKDPNKDLLTGAPIPPPTAAAGGKPAPGAPPGGKPPGGDKPPGGKPFGGPPTGNSGWRKVRREPDRVYRVVRNAAGKVEVKDEGEEDNPGDKTIGQKVVKGAENDVYDSPAGYSVEWPDLSALGPKDKAAIALQVVQALAAYVQGNVEALVPPRDLLADIIGPIYGWDEEKAGQILGDAKTAAEPMTMPAMGEDGHPATEQEPPPPPPLMVPHGSDISDDVQTPGGVVTGPKPPAGDYAQHPAFQIPGKGAPVQNPMGGPPGGAPGGSPFGKGGPGAVAKKNAKDKAKPVQNVVNSNPEGHNQYTTGQHLEMARQRHADASRAFQTEIQQPARTKKQKEMRQKVVKELGEAERAYQEAHEAHQSNPTQNAIDRKVAPSAPAWAGETTSVYGDSAPGSEGEEVPRQSSSREDADEDDDGSTFSTDYQEPMQNATAGIKESWVDDYRQDKPEEDDRLQHPDAPLSSETGTPRSSPTEQPSDAQRQHTLGDGGHPEEIGHGGMAGMGALNTSSGRKEEWTAIDALGHQTSTTVDLPDLLERAAELRASGLGQPDYCQLYVRGAEIWWVGGDSDERGFDALVKEELGKVKGVSIVTYGDGEQHPKGEDWVRVWPNGNPNLGKTANSNPEGLNQYTLGGKTLDTWSHEKKNYEVKQISPEHRRYIVEHRGRMYHAVSADHEDSGPPDREKIQKVWKEERHSFDPYNQ